MKRKWTHADVNLDFNPGVWALEPPLRRNPSKRRKQREVVQPRGDTVEEIDAAARRAFPPDLLAWIESWG